MKKEHAALAACEGGATVIIARKREAMSDDLYESDHIKLAMHQLEIGSKELAEVFQQRVSRDELQLKADARAYVCTAHQLLAHARSLSS
jgi:hypothetical protein